MIREKTILCKLNRIKFSDKQLLDSLKPERETCPACGARSSCNPHAAYERSMITFFDGIRKDETVSVQRVRCSSCGKTHALLSDILIPFGSYSLRFVFHILRAYLTRTKTVAALCASFCIAVSTLYKWIQLFKEHANLLLCAMQQIAWVTIPALHFIEGIVSLPSLFSRRYHFSFLQNRKRQTAVPSPP